MRGPLSQPALGAARRSERAAWRDALRPAGGRTAPALPAVVAVRADAARGRDERVPRVELDQEPAAVPHLLDGAHRQRRAGGAAGDAVGAGWLAHRRRTAPHVRSECCLYRRASEPVLTRRDSECPTGIAAMRARAYRRAKRAGPTARAQRVRPYRVRSQRGLPSLPHDHPHHAVRAEDALEDDVGGGGPGCHGEDEPPPEPTADSGRLRLDGLDK